jgi:signal transduction histidine kinase
MHDQLPTPPRDELRSRRETIRRGLNRANTAVLAIVAVVLGLALAAVLGAYRALDHAEQARTATHRAEQELWRSFLAQATAGRLSGTMGRKTAGQQIIAAAARIGPSLELRNEAIAHLALTDVDEANHFEALATNATGLALAPDMTRYALAEADGAVRVRRLIDHTTCFEWHGTNSPAAFVAFSPDARYLAFDFPATEFVVFDLETGEPSFRGPASRPFDFSPEGGRLAILSDPKTVQFFESRSGHQVSAPLQLADAAEDLAFGPHADRLALRLGSALEIWDLTNRAKLQTLEHGQAITSMAWSGRYLAVGDGSGEIQVWDLEATKSRRWMAHKGLVSELLLSHKAEFLASSSFDGSCRIWDAQTANLLGTTTKGFASAFSRDDALLGYRKQSGRGGWGCWRVVRARGFRTLNCADRSEPNVWHTDFSPDGSLLAVIKADGLRVFDFSTGRLLASQPMRRARSGYFLADGKALVTCGDDRLSIWPLESEGVDKRCARLGTPTHIALPKIGYVDSAGISFDRRQIALPLTDSEAVMIDLENPDHRVAFTNEPIPKLPAISSDGKWVVTGTFHGRGSTLWDAVTGRKLLDLGQSSANPFFSPDAKLLVLAGDREYRILESGSWKLLWRIPTDNPGNLPNCAAFSRDGRLLAIVKARHRVELLEPRTGATLAALTPPEAQIINWLTFNWEGSVLAAATSADLVQLWDLQAVRHELDQAGLNWNDTRATKGTPRNVSAPFPIASAHSPSSATFTILVAAGVALVLFCAAFVLRRQRHLFATYLAVDELIEQRNHELEVAQTEVMHSQKMKALGTLAAGIAHDFNNLLSIIRMSNKLVGRRAKGDSEIEENVAEVERAVQQGKSVVHSMLGYSREDTGADGRISLPDLVEGTVGLLSRQFLSGITLKLELDQNIPLVHGSTARLEQILLNLVVNASEAMNGKGNLGILVRNKAAADDCLVRPAQNAPRYVELVVTDSGPGIDPQILPLIFEPFFTTKTVGTTRGTGLGLAMVYSLAEQDGLGIAVESLPGKGSTFRMVVPVHDETPP